MITTHERLNVAPGWFHCLNPCNHAHSLVLRCPSSVFANLAGSLYGKCPCSVDTDSRATHTV